MKKIGEGFKRKSQQNEKKKEKNNNIFIEAKQLATQLHVWVA